MDGLRKLQKRFEEFNKELTGLGGRITTLEFDPNDPLSIERAIDELNLEIDNRVNNFHRIPEIDKIVDQIKQKFRHQILERAARMRQDG